VGDVMHANATLSQWYYLDYLQTGVMIIDKQYRIVYWNRWLEYHSNILSETIQGQSFKIAFPDLADSRLFELVQQVIEENLSGMISAALNRSLLPLYPSINHQLKQINVMNQMVQVTGMHDANGQQLAMVQVTDMTHSQVRHAQIKAQSQTIEALENVDQLTRLPNREKFDHDFHQEFKRIMRARANLVATIIEVDHFDNFERQYGANKAQEVLVKISDIFSSLLCRDTDIVTRYNKDSFALILPYTSEAGSQLIAQELRKAVHALKVPHALSATSSALTVSIGLAFISPQSNEEEPRFVEALNFALAAAKEAGGDRAMLYTMADGRLTDCDGPHSDGQLLLAL